MRPFLYMETGSQFGHVSSVSDLPRDWTIRRYDPYTAWRTRSSDDSISSSRFGGGCAPCPPPDHPFWIEDSGASI